MANGDSGIPRVPGFLIGGAVSLSNTAIVFGGLALITLAWLTMNKNGGGGERTKMAMDDETQGQMIESDVLAYAADTRSAHANRDRIRAAINRIRDQFRVARENYRKKLRDLIIARRKGTITQAQFRTQHQAALTEFRNAIKQRHKEIMEALGIPRFHADAATPTVA